MQLFSVQKLHTSKGVPWGLLLLPIASMLSVLKAFTLKLPHMVP